MAYRRICRFCGNWFETLDYRVRYCSDDCRQRADAINYRAQKERELLMAEQRKQDQRMALRNEKARRSASTLSAVAKAASDMGMTYGQYMVYLKGEVK